MKIPYFCCIGAELKRYMKDFDFMNQVYLYKVPTDDTIDEVLAQDYFKAISDSVLQDDIIYIYEASAEILHECRFDKQNGHITAVPLASDETLTGAVTTIIHDNLTAGKVVVSDSDGKIAVSETDADELAVLHGLEATTEELNYSHGVTSNIQDQLDSTVHKAGAETITGDKKFTKTINFESDIYSADFDIIKFTDTSATPRGSTALSASFASSGMWSILTNRNLTTNYSAILSIFNSDAGSIALSFDSPDNVTNQSLSMTETSTSSTTIPTMGWVNNPDLNNIVHKTGNESIGGNKTFSGTTTFSGATALSSGTITTAPTNNNDITNKNYVDTKVNTAAVPVGAIVSFAAVPAGWLACDGSAVSRTDYADLFAAIGTTFGPGDGISTFNLPNLKSAYDTMIPTGQYEDITLLATNSEYTAPENCFLEISCSLKNVTQGSNTNSFVDTLNNRFQVMGGTSTYLCGSLILPLYKGQKFNYGYQSNVKTDYFRYLFVETTNTINAIKY